MENASNDQNSVKSLLAVSNADGRSTVTLYADPVTHRLLVDLPGGSGTVTSVSVVTANGFSGTVANATTTPAITIATTVTGILQGNGTAISAITIGSGLSFAGGTLSATGSGLTVGTTTITSGTNGRILYDNSGVLGELATTGSGSVVLATSPTLVTPVLGAATATSVNKVTITAPATSATLTIADGKTLTANNSITLVGTDSTTMTFPSTSASIARTDAAQTFTGTQTFANTVLTANAITATSNAATIPVTSGRNIVTNNSAATLTVTLTTAGAVNMQTCMVQILDFSAAAQTLTLVNTENSTVTPPATTNGSTTLPLTLGFVFNSATTKWRLIASA